MSSLGDACVAGYRHCAEGTARATRVRRLGSLPIAIAAGCCDIGEAYVQYPDGESGHALITWGRNLIQGEQIWHINNSTFTPVWVGCDDGRAELILCPAHPGNKVFCWLQDGLRLVNEGPRWELVPGGGE